jgi:hypothetical protein
VQGIKKPAGRRSPERPSGTSTGHVRPKAASDDLGPRGGKRGGVEPVSPDATATASRYPARLSSLSALDGSNVDLLAVLAPKQRDFAGFSYAWDRGNVRHWPLAFDAKRRHRPSRWGRWVVGHRPVLLFAGGSAVESLSHRCQRRRTDDVRSTATPRKTFPRNPMNCP